MSLSTWLTNQNIPHIAVASSLVDSDGNHIENEADFRAWFADSKVTDSQGNPLVVHHGSNQPIRGFKQMPNEEITGKSVGFYFTPDEEAAGQYGTLAESYYLKAKRIVSLPKKLTHKQAFRLIDTLGIDRSHFNRLVEKGLGKRFNYVHPFHLLKDGDSDWGGDDLILGSLVMDELRKRGVDCVRFVEAQFNNDTANAVTYCVFSSSQIRHIADFVSPTDGIVEYGLHSGWNVKTESGLVLPMASGIKGTIPVKVVKQSGKFHVYTSDKPVTDHERGRTYHPISGPERELDLA